MTSWVLPIKAGLDEHWTFAKQIQAWDTATSHRIVPGDRVYFWQASNKGIRGRAIATSSVIPVPATLPWHNKTEVDYKYRVCLTSFENFIGDPVEWKQVATALGNVNFPAGQIHSTSTPDGDPALAALFGDLALTPSDGNLPSFDAAQALLSHPIELESDVAPDRDALDIDTRQRTLAAITLRRGQPAFRKLLLHHYVNTCAVTGTTEDRVLEAAHIFPYRGEHTNVVGNGILLRADIHTLFDSLLLTIISVPDDGYIVQVSPEVTDPKYRELDGKQLARVPSDAQARPGLEWLQRHHALCPWLGLTVSSA